MKDHPKLPIRQILLFSLIIMLAGSVVGCGGSTTPSTPTLVPTNTPEPAPTPTPAPPPAPTLDQLDVVTLDAGQQMPVSAKSPGASSFKWTLQGPGDLSSDNIPVIIYTAPEGAGNIAVLSVTAYSVDGLASPPTSITITVNPGKVTIKELVIGTPKENAKIPTGQKTDCSGTYELSFGSDTTGIYVWLLAGDIDGNYYLQAPPVSLGDDGTWSTSIQLGSGITTIFAVQVTEVGNDVFNRMVEDGEFGAFRELPEGYIIHHSIKVQT